MKFLDPDTEGAIRDFLARIPTDIKLDRAILFGSRARGEHRPDSDADLALILHEGGVDTFLHRVKLPVLCQSFDSQDPATIGSLIFIALIVGSWFAGISRGMTLFAAMLLALPYLTLCGGPAGFTSMARFNIVSFPLFLVMARVTERWRWAVPGIVGIFGGLLLMYAALFAQWQWIG